MTRAFVIGGSDGVKPALSAWEFNEIVRIIQNDQHSSLPLSAREIPRFTGANGTLMARRQRQRAAVTRWGDRGGLSVLQPLFVTGHRDRELERVGTPGTLVRGACPHPLASLSQFRRGAGTLGTPGTLFVDESRRAPSARRPAPGARDTRRYRLRPTRPRAELGGSALG